MAARSAPMAVKRLLALSSRQSLSKSSRSLLPETRRGLSHLSSSSRRSFSTTTTVPITYVEADGTEKTVDAEIGHTLLEVAHDHHVELEGACGGELACSTCHLVFPKHIYDTLPDKEDEEDDMLDLAFEVTETSRLGCQIRVRPDFAGLKVQIPDDGFN